MASQTMESRHRAERLRELQAANQRRLAQEGISTEDLPELIRKAYKGPSGDR